MPAILSGIKFINRSSFMLKSESCNSWKIWKILRLRDSLSGELTLSHFHQIGWNISLACSMSTRNTAAIRALTKRLALTSERLQGDPVLCWYQRMLNAAKRLESGKGEEEDSSSFTMGREAGAAYTKHLLSCLSSASAWKCVPQTGCWKGEKRRENLA